MAGVWSWGEEPAAAPVRVPARPHRSVEDLLGQVWARRFLMLAVFLGLLLVGLAAVSQLKTTYTADSSLLVRLGQAYVYDPKVGDAARGAAPTNDEVIQSELEILGSSELKTRVIRDVGLARLSPALAAMDAKARTPEQHREAEGAAVRLLDGGLKLKAAPDTSIIRLSFTHRDARTAALVLNTLVDEDLRYRQQVLNARDVGPLEAQRRTLADELARVDAQSTRFLTDNGIGDFDAEKASLAQLYGQLLADGASARASLSEAEGRLGVTSALAARSPSEIGLYRDLDHAPADQLAKLRTDLNDLLARYRPTSQPVRDKQAQVAAAEALVRGGDALVVGRRLGPNPVLQTLQTERNTTAAQASSMRARAGELQGELARVVARRQRLAQLEPQWLDLQRQRDVLTADVRTFTQRVQDSRAQQALSAAGDDGDVRVVQRAYTPTRGASLKAPALLAATAFAGFAALCAGLLAAFLSRGFPSAGAAERTLDMPVLAAVPARGRRGAARA